jgi:hypothetical protein
MQQAVNTPTSSPAYSRGVAWANMASTSTPTSSATNLLPAGPSCQPCPDCGGLECLCRPRFFAGQLLTEQDLNRLDQYIVAKNQLHNRYLVGSGVVCGLEVKCSPCANTVSVSSGYAIDTCGNDIIVCSADTVDICKLIAACTPSTAVNCAPYKDQTQCKELEQEWILAIRYQEVPSRGTTALTGSAQCSCGSAGACSCGSAVSKACGCGSMMPAASCCGQTISNTSTVSTNLPRRGAPPSCEPTVTCEAYRYEVFLAPQAPATATGNAAVNVASLAHGAMFERIACCVQALIAAMPKGPQPVAGETQLQWQTAQATFCCDLRLALMDLVQAQGGSDCGMLAKLRAAGCPTPGEANFENDYTNALLELAVVMIEILRDCICSAALPPCPMPGDPRVPLASVRIRATDCTILSVCDWTPLRKNAVTLRTLGYWLGWLPIVPMIRTFMQELCCRALRLPEQLRGMRTTTPAPAPATPGAATGAPRDVVVGQGGDGFSALDGALTFSARSYQASNPISEAIAYNLAGRQNLITVDTLLTAITAPVNSGATTEQLASSPHARVGAEIARPLINAFGPLLNAAAGKLTQDAAPADTAAMRSELDALKATVAAQQATLDALRQQQGGPPEASAEPPKPA